MPSCVVYTQECPTFSILLCKINCCLINTQALLCHFFLSQVIPINIPKLSSKEAFIPMKINSLSHDTSQKHKPQSLSAAISTFTLLKSCPKFTEVSVDFHWTSDFKEFLKFIFRFKNEGLTIIKI